MLRCLATVQISYNIDADKVLSIFWQLFMVQILAMVYYLINKTRLGLRLQQTLFLRQTGRGFSYNILLHHILMKWN